MPVRTMALAPDPQVAQRDLLVDPVEVARRLSPRLGHHGPITIECCERVRVKYRIGESLRVVHRVRVEGVWYVISARTFRNGSGAEAYHRAADVAVGCGPLRPVVHDEALDTVFWTFPNDRKITRLWMLAGDPTPLEQMIGRPLSGTRVVAYAPEKIATLQCLDTESTITAYAKVYAGDEGARSYAVHASLADSVTTACNDLRVPMPMAFSAAHRTLVLEPINGRCLADLDGPALRAVARRLGVALARLHSAPPPDTRPSLHPGLERLQHVARLLGHARPDVASLAHDLARDLAARWEASGDLPTCLHGDVNFRNWIIGEDGVGLIDLDLVSVGPAAADLGSLLSGLRYRHRIGRISRMVERQSASAVLAGYASVRALPAASAVRWYTAAALLTERALRAVTWMRSEALPHLDVLLRDARVILRGDGDV
jgi:hypothetical protein